jgi:HEAT repeat protein
VTLDASKERHAPSHDAPTPGGDAARAETSMDEQLALNIQLLQDPSGDEHHRRQHGRALEYLLVHADQSHALLLALLEEGRVANPHALVEALPHFGRPESVPVLAAMLERGPTSLRAAAARALADHPREQALAALLGGLTSADPETTAAAANGLLLRQDPAACPALRASLDHADRVVRHQVVQAAVRLGCLDEAMLATIARDDSDEEVRALARAARGRADR